MSGKQIENLFSLIDSNIERIDEEAAAYIEANLVELAKSLKEQGFAIVRTNTGPLRLEKDDLAVCA